MRLKNSRPACRSRRAARDDSKRDVMTRATAARATLAANTTRASDGRVHEEWWSYIESRVQVLLLALFSGSVDVVHECVTRDDVVLCVAFIDAHAPHRLARFRPAHVKLDGDLTYKRITKSLKNAIGFSASKVAAKERMRAKTGATVDDVSTRLAKYVSALDNRRARCRGATSASNCVTGSITPELFVLELGKGTGPFQRFLATSRNDDVVVVFTVDNDARCQPDFQLDIFEWPRWIDDVIEKVRTRYPNFPGFFHYVHFSPECTELSSCKTVGVRDVVYAEMLAKVGMSLILKLAPMVWTIESSASGKYHLATRDVIQGLLPRKVNTAIHFCACGRLNWKPGGWWTNIPYEYYSKYLPSPCVSGSQCLTKLLKGQHRNTSQNGQSSNGTPGMRRDDAMSFPDELVRCWLSAAALWLWECDDS
mmetsp:Transcript_3008/g.9949  ORF Transcript_3008/g.9949 Transcript_3008/m.9949 type:complete len:423 (-) Transcript_3008:65-1333(-)